jgi:hybrid cluster-associated redox disulfide protein
MESEMLSPNLIVADLLKTWPETIPVFIKYRMACVGCSMSPFETLKDAAGIYRLPYQQFLDDLQGAIWSAQP